MMTVDRIGKANLDSWTVGRKWSRRIPTSIIYNVVHVQNRARTRVEHANESPRPSRAILTLIHESKIFIFVSKNYLELSWHNGLWLVPGFYILHLRVDETKTEIVAQILTLPLHCSTLLFFSQILLSANYKLANPYLVHVSDMNFTCHHRVLDMKCLVCHVSCVVIRKNINGSNCNYCTYSCYPLIASTLRQGKAGNYFVTTFLEPSTMRQKAENRQLPVKSQIKNLFVLSNELNP
jgi:hypothetical protein